MVVSAAKAGVF